MFSITQLAKSINNFFISIGMSGGLRRRRNDENLNQNPPEVIERGVQGMFLCMGRFRIQCQLGLGAFGAVYKCFDFTEEDEVALKIEDTNVVTDGTLRREYEAYKVLQGGPGISRVRYFGHYFNFAAMAMDQIGSSLNDLFELCSSHFSLKTVLIVAEKTLKSLEFIHSKKYIHGDLKPDNILISKGEVFIIDFGLCEKFWDDAKNRHIFYREGLPPASDGGTAFAPARVHYGHEKSRRDDMESLALTLIYFQQGDLPWLGLDKSQFAKLKTDMSVNELCKDLPEEFATFLEYCRGLRFDEAPDYDYCRQLFRGLFEKMGFEDDDVYDWVPIIEKMKKDPDFNSDIDSDSDDSSSEEKSSRAASRTSTVPSK